MAIRKQLKLAIEKLEKRIGIFDSGYQDLTTSELNDYYESLIDIIHGRIYKPIN
jgi:hypothetical protein